MLPLLPEESLMLYILNFLNEPDVLNISKALGGGSIVVSDDRIVEDEYDNSEIYEGAPDKYRSIICSDDWLDQSNMDQLYLPIASEIIETLTKAYERGCSIIVAAIMGVFSVPSQICSIFNLETEWT